LTLDADVQMVIWVNGTLTGLRTFLVAIYLSVFCARQLVLAHLRHVWAFPQVPVISTHRLAGLCHVDSNADLFLFVSGEHPGRHRLCDLLCPILSCLHALFRLLGHQEPGNHADLQRLPVECHGGELPDPLSLWLTIQYQPITIQTYVFETAITYLFASVYFISTSIVLLPPFYKWRFHPEILREWDEFNKKNMYQQNSFRIFGHCGILVSNPCCFCMIIGHFCVIMVN